MLIRWERGVGAAARPWAEDPLRRSNKYRPNICIGVRESLHVHTIIQVHVDTRLYTYMYRCSVRIHEMQS